MGRVGVGDMKKAVYDPDKDGLIALAQLAAAVCSETEADNKITDHAALFTGLHGITVVRKTADQIVNNSTTLVNDTHLLFPMAANEIWDVVLLIRITTAGSADWKYKLTLPTAGAGRFTQQSNFYTADDFAASYSDASTPSLDTGASITDQWVLVWAAIVNGVNAGNFQLQWAQKTAHESDTKVLTNSLILAHKVG